MKQDKGNSVTVSNSTFEVTISIIMTTVAILALTIYLPFQSSLNRGKQRRTMADIRAISQAVEAYHVDFHAYPTGKSTVEEIRKIPEGYMEEVPLEDGWRNKFLYRSNGLTSYTIISFGKDREQDGPSIYQGAITNFSNDIVFGNGFFISFPEGLH